MRNPKFFEDGVLTADALPNRFERNTWGNDGQFDRSSTYARRAERDEMNTLNQLNRLVQAGYRPDPGQSIEEFVEQHKDTV